MAAAFSVVPCALAGQARPTPEQAAELLRTRPDLVQQLRQRIGTSGLTPEQVRARLRAEGYPENLLDAYLGGGMSTGDSLPNADVFSAVRSLGITDQADLDFLQTGAADCAVPTLPDTGVGERPDSAAKARAARIRSERCRLADSARVLATRRGRLARLADIFPDSGFAVYGLDVFASGTTQFDANAAGPVDPSYRLGPGDRLVLILTGDVEASYQLDVTREGFIVIPQVGQLNVANLTLGELDALLYSRLGRVYSGVRRGGDATTRFTVSVARLRSNQVYVVGDVGRPGSYRVSSTGTTLTALYAAGGPTENGSLRRVEVRRGGRLVGTLDVYDYLLRGDASRDVRLQSGDVVFVPVHGARARVAGEVTRPATYEMREGETLADVLAFAGGFQPGASGRNILVERVVPLQQRGAAGSDRNVITISVGGAGSPTDAGRIPVEAGDIIRVFPVTERVRNRIAVRGSVWAPGTYGLAPGMTLSQALRRAGGVRPDVYLGQVLVTRLRPDSSRVQLRASLRDTTGAVVNDLALQEDDEIRVFSTSEFRPARYVAVTGAVRNSGQYPYREGMTLRDLVLLAGGLRESADLRAAEVARLPESRVGGATAQTLRVPLDSSYLFERGPDGHFVGAPGLPAPGGPASEVPLRPYDNVLVFSQPDWELLRTVFVGGEVRFPGRYTIQSKTERIRDLIQRAGGLTSEGHADGVVFVRKSVTRAADAVLANAVNLVTRDTTSGGLEVTGVLRSGRVGIDLPSALRDPSTQDNLVLQDGDSIFVPRYNPVVTVVGAVNSPVAVSWVAGQSIDYYIRAAGGPRRDADVRRSFVTQPNGKVESVRRRPLWPDGEPEPRAGGVVAVPVRDPNDKKDFAAVFSQTLTALSTLAGLVVTVIAIRNSTK